jgi:hypothetical protein
MSNPYSFYSNGLGHVPSFQASARPYLTASLDVPANTEEPIEVSFETVTRFVVITNNTPATSTNVPMRFGFSANGVKGVENNNYGILNNGESFEAEFKVVSVYLLSDSVNNATASVIAGLTGIDNQRLVDNWTGSSGVG